LRCRADDFCRLVALADYVLCASPQPYLQVQQPSATLYIASLKKSLCHCGIAHKKLVEPI
jgi:hypothetical protein